jgi:hypothetical protein
MGTERGKSMTFVKRILTVWALWVLAYGSGFLAAVTEPGWITVAICVASFVFGYVVMGFLGRDD